MYDCKRSYLESDHQRHFSSVLRPSWDKSEPALVLDFGSMFTPKSFFKPSFNHKGRVRLPNRMNFRKSAIVSPKIHVADFGNFKQGFLSMKLIQNSIFSPLQNTSQITSHDGSRDCLQVTKIPEQSLSNRTKLLGGLASVANGWKNICSNLHCWRGEKYPQRSHL